MNVQRAALGLALLLVGGGSTDGPVAATTSGTASARVVNSTDVSTNVFKSIMHLPTLQLEAKTGSMPEPADAADRSWQVAAEALAGYCSGAGLPAEGALNGAQENPGPVLAVQVKRSGGCQVILLYN